METVYDFRRWDDLSYDILGMIFTNLSLQEKLTMIPCVCKSWGEVMVGPYCWKDIDIGDWNQGCDPEKVDRMVEMLIRRSSRSLKKLRVFKIQTERTFTFIGENAKSLKILRLMRCNMSDHIVEEISPKLCRISFLDMTACRNIGAYALEIIGKNCKTLEGLNWTMHPMDTFDKPLQNDEAFAIASSMPNLKHLAMTYNLMDTTGVLQILSNCLKVEFLDIRGSWGVKLDKDMVKESFPKLKLIGPSPEISRVYKSIWPGK